MPTTPDRYPGSREEDELKLTPESSDPVDVGAIRLVSGYFRLRDNEGVFNPREAASGISEATHKTLRQLIHFIDDGPAEGFASGAFREILPSGNPFPTSVIWWDSSSKTTKILELTITRDSGQKPTQEQWKMYDVSGSVLVTLTDAITYSGVFETSRTRTWS